MPVFISYSHADKACVDMLAAHLVKRNAHVWVDSWELNVGDSIIGRVQEAIQDSSALLVILSKASVQSEFGSFDDRRRPAEHGASPGDQGAGIASASKDHANR